MIRAVLVDLLCNSPYYCAPLAGALRAAGIEAELASPRFYLEPRFIDAYPRAPWIVDLTVMFPRPRLLRLVTQFVEGLLNFAHLMIRILQGEYDVVHVQWIPFEDRALPFMPLLRWACDRSSTLLVLTVHDAVPHDDPLGRHSGFKRNLDQAHQIIALSEHVATQLSEVVATVVPITVIPHGALFLDHSLPASGEAAERLGLTTGPVVLFLGLIKPYKGLDLLAEAWTEVRSRFPSATLVVVGRVLGDGRDLKMLRLLEGVRIVVRYVGVDEMLDYHAIADVVVFPYRRISQSGAVMTAIGLGRPTVVTPVAGLREQVQDFGSSIVADAISGEAFARAVISSLERRQELAGAAEDDRAAIAGSPIAPASVARATARQYAHGLDRLRGTCHPVGSDDFRAT